MSSTEQDASPVPNDGCATGQPVRDWWVVGGMAVAAISAALASFSGLYGLASVAGWPRRLAWLLPLTLDAHAMTSARVWLADTTRSTAARRFARANALGAIVMSIGGNAAYHAIGTGLLDLTWPIIEGYSPERHAMARTRRGCGGSAPASGGPGGRPPRAT